MADNQGWKNKDHRFMVSLVIYSLATLVACLLRLLGYDENSVGFEFSTAIFVLIIIHCLYSATRTIPLGYVGAVIFFDKFILEKYEKGMIFVPWGIYELRRISRRVQEVNIPEEPIWRGNLDEMPAGYHESFRATFAEADDVKVCKELGISPYEKSDDQDKVDPLSEERYTGEPQFRATYLLSNIERFYDNFESEKAFKDVLDEILRSAGQIIFGKITIGTALKSIKEINAYLKKEAQDALQQKVGLGVTEFGVSITDIKVSVVGMSKGTNEKIAARVEARYDAEKTRITADGDAYSTRVRGQAEAEAKAAVFKEVGKIMGENPDAGKAYVIKQITDAIGQSHPTIISGLGGGDQLTTIITAALGTYFQDKQREGNKT